MLDTYKEPGNFLSFIDKSLLERDNDKDYDNVAKLALSLCNDDMSYLLDNVNLYISNENYISSALDFISKLTYLANYNEIAFLTKMAIYKDYRGFISNILGSLEKWSFNEGHYIIQEKLPTIINSCVFIVKDKDKFINILSKTLYDKCEGSINKGAKSSRGQINSSFNFLSLLDSHFRNSLYYHNLYHSHKSIQNYHQK